MGGQPLRKRVLDGALGAGQFATLDRHGPAQQVKLARDTIRSLRRKDNFALEAFWAPVEMHFAL